MDNKKELIEKILILDENNQAYNISSGDETQTFFEIIGKSKDENLISRMLAYTLKKDKLLFGKLLAFYFNRRNDNSDGNCDYLSCEVTDIKCEKTMLNGRADIFVQGKDKYGNIYTLTIENKVDSIEHDQQTQTYYDYVIGHPNFKESRKAFLFLKPDYNYSPISCDQFEPLLYSELLERIDKVSEDLFIQDFCKHIEKWLKNTKVNFMEVDTLIFQNFGTLKQIFSDAERKLENFKLGLFQEICKGNLIAGLDVNYNVNSRKENKARYTSEENDNDTLCVWTESNKIQIFRDKWYYEPDASKAGYYFYVEMMFDNNDPNEIIFQKVGHDYSDKLIVRQFSTEYKVKYKGNGDRWTVFTDHSGQEKFNDDNHELLSDDWKNALKDFAVQKLSTYIKEMDEIFKCFREWKINKFN